MADSQSRLKEVACSLVMEKNRREFYEKKDLVEVAQFGFISLLTVEGKIVKFMRNKLIDTSVQKARIQGFPGCLEHTSMIWNQFQSAKRGETGFHMRECEDAAPVNLVVNSDPDEAHFLLLTPHICLNQAVESHHNKTTRHNVCPSR